MSKAHRLTTVAAICAALASISCTGPSPLPQGEIQNALSGLSKSDHGTSAGIFRDVNAYRARFGKPALRRHTGLDRLAQAHSEFLRANRGKFTLSKTGNVSHFGFEGRAAVARTKYGLASIHENVAAGPREISIIKVWANSSGHEPAMRGDWACTGVGVAVDSDGMIFATQLFGSPGPQQMTLRQTLGGW